MTAFALKAFPSIMPSAGAMAKVSRRMWNSRWPDSSGKDVPINYITNGIHVPTWIEPKMERLLEQEPWGVTGWLTTMILRWGKLSIRSRMRRLWQTHYWLKVKLLNRICEQARQAWTVP